VLHAHGFRGPSLGIRVINPRTREPGANVHANGFGAFAERLSVNASVFLWRARSPVHFDTLSCPAQMEIACPSMARRATVLRSQGSLLVCFYPHSPSYPPAVRRLSRMRRVFATIPTTGCEPLAFLCHSIEFTGERCASNSSGRFSTPGLSLDVAWRNWKRHAAAYRISIASPPRFLSLFLRLLFNPVLSPLSFPRMLDTRILRTLAHDKWHPMPAIARHVNRSFANRPAPMRFIMPRVAGLKIIYLHVTRGCATSMHRD